MHSPEENSSAYTLDDACDRVLDAFIDSFVVVVSEPIPSDRWLQRLVKELENTRDEIRGLLQRTDHVDYRKNLRRCIRRVENVLEQLYEEQLHY